MSAYAFYTAQPLLSDVSYFVAADQRILRGAVPYIDIIENNPPLAFWVTMPAVWLAHVTGFAAEPAFAAFVLMLSAAMLLLLWWLHAEDLRGKTYRQRLVLIIAMVTGFGLAFGFGQREYFATVLLVPYVSSLTLLMGKQSVLKPQQVVIGVLAGLAVCFKPYFLLIPICLEVFLLLHTKKWRALFRTEIVVAGVIILLYPAVVWFFYPVYFSEILPLTVLTYGAFRASTQAMLLSSTVIIFLLAACVTIAIIALSRLRDQSILVWVVAAFAGLAIHFLQHMGWPYHLLPGLAFITIALVLAVFQLKQPVVQMLVCITLLACIGPGLADYRQSQQQRVTRFDNLMKNTQPQRMMMLTYDLGAAFPFMPAHRIEWVGHYQSLWPMVAVGKNKISATTGNIVIANIAKNLAFDLNGQKPDHVIVDHRPFSDRPEAGDDNPVERLQAFADFSAAWAAYDMVAEDGAFQLWKRQQRAAP